MEKIKVNSRIKDSKLYIKVKCSNEKCDNSFYKKKDGSTRRLPIGVKSSQAKTCSKGCSHELIKLNRRIYQRRYKDKKKKENETNEKNKNKK